MSTPNAGKDRFHISLPSEPRSAETDVENVHAQ
jgi:hypothetical protein